MSAQIPPTPPAQAVTNGQAPVPAQVKALPPALLTVDRATPIKGEVTQIDRDGTVRIATSKGEVQLRIDPPPQRGQVVELRITPPPQPQTPAQSTAQQQPPQPQAQLPTGQNTATQQQGPQTQTALPQVTVKAGVVHTTPTSQTTAAPNATATSAQTTSLNNLQAFANGPAKLLQTASHAIKTLINGTPQATSSSPSTASGLITATTEIATQARPLTIGANLRLLNLTTPQATSPLSTNGNSPLQAQPGSNARAPLLSYITPSITQTQSGATTPIQSNTPTPHLDARVTGIQSANASVTPTVSTASSNNASPATAATTGGPLITQALPGPVQPGGQFLAQVLGFTPQSLPILSASLTAGQPAQTMILQFPTNNLSVGDLVRLSPTSQTLPQTAQTGANTVDQTGLRTQLNVQGPVAIQAQNSGAMTFTQAQTPVFTGFSGEWPALEEALDTLLQALPADQSSALRQIIPQPMAGMPRLDAPAMLFIAALRSGDIGQWLGERNIQSLTNAGKAALVSRLMNDMAGMSARATDPAPIPSAGGEWRAVSLPMLFGADFGRMQIFVSDHHPDHEGDDLPSERKKDWLRFVMNVDLSRLGPLQLDGVHSDKQKTLDLLLKTGAEIGPDMRKMMRTHFTRLMEGLDMSGSLDFKTDPDQDHWVRL